MLLRAALVGSPCPCPAPAARVLVGPPPLPPADVLRTLVAEELGDAHLYQPDGRPAETLYLYKCKEVTFLSPFVLAVYIDRVYMEQTEGRIYLDELGVYI